jgi:hypothetical protein
MKDPTKQDIDDGLATISALHDFCEGLVASGIRRTVVSGALLHVTLLHMKKANSITPEAAAAMLVKLFGDRETVGHMVGSIESMEGDNEGNAGKSWGRVK